MKLTDEIYTMAAFFAPSDESGGTILRSMCLCAEAEVSARLKKGVRQEDCAESFICAAAMVAASHLIAAQAAKMPQSFSAGEVSVKEKSDAQVCKLQQQAEQIMAPYCVNGFSFQGVRG